MVEIRNELNKKREIEEQMKKSKIANAKMKAQMQEQKRKIQKKDNDLIDNYKTLKLNQMTTHFKQNETSLGVAKSRKLNDPFTPASNENNSLGKRNSKRFSYNLEDAEELNKSIDQSIKPKSPNRTNYDQNTLTLTMKERDSIFTSRNYPSKNPKARGTVRELKQF